MSSSEGIVVFCPRGNVIFSSTGEMITNKQTVRKHKVNKNVIYEEFDQMKSFTEDEFWKIQLTKFSRNNFDRNFKYIENVVYYKPKTKKYRSECFIDKENLEDSFNRLLNFFKSKGMLSNKDKKNINEILNLELEGEKQEITQWKEIVKNRNFYLLDFIQKLKNKYNLTNQKKNELESKIRFGVSCDFFNNDNIIIKNGVIEKILNLNISENGEKIEIDIENIKDKKKSDKKKILSNYTTYTVETSNDGIIVMKKKNNNIDLEKKAKKFFSQTIFKDEN